MKHCETCAGQWRQYAVWDRSHPRLDTPFMVNNGFPVFIFNQHTAQTPRKHLEIQCTWSVTWSHPHQNHSRPPPRAWHKGVPLVHWRCEPGAAACPCSDYDYTSDFDIEAASCERSDILLRLRRTTNAMRPTRKSAVPEAK